MNPGRPVPLDPNGQPADADRERALEYLRRKLATTNMHPARRNLMQQEVRDLERMAA